MRYPVAKLADWRTQLQTLEERDNPFAVAVLAHLAAQDTRGDAERREVAKLGLIRRLYERGYDRERVLSLFGFIDWLLALPLEHEARVRFGGVPDDLGARLASIDEADLDGMIQHVGTVVSVADL